MDVLGSGYQSNERNSMNLTTLSLMNLMQRAMIAEAFVVAVALLCQPSYLNAVPVDFETCVYMFNVFFVGLLLIHFLAFCSSGTCISTNQYSINYSTSL